MPYHRSGLENQPSLGNTMYNIFLFTVDLIVEPGINVLIVTTNLIIMVRLPVLPVTKILKQTKSIITSWVMRIPVLLAWPAIPMVKQKILSIMIIPVLH
jgi:hypothetical protein